jgi:CO/xanthine dehydrogenase Mo-binding subunit
MADFETVGRSVTRVQSADKVSGRAVYVDDIVRPGMLHTALVLSPYPNAQILTIDTDAAAKAPGVRCILTGADFPHRFGGFIHDEVVLASGRVRYAGEPVAAIAADTLAQARHAASLVVVDYEELPAVTSIEEALAPGAPLVHEQFAQYARRHMGPLGPNLCAHTVLSEGEDVEAALARCDMVVEGEYRTQAQVHAYLEPCGAVAEVEQGGKITVWSPCQSVFRVQATLSEILGLPMSRIRAVATTVGGSFGGKADVTVQPLAAMLALRTRRPVKVVLTRDDEFAMMRTRHPARVRVRTGAMRDGTLVARAVDLVFDGGAYAEDSSAVLGFALLMARGPYRIPNVRCEGKAVYTNRLRAAGFRGYGNPQVTFAGESQLDELAERLGMDPIELRLRNAVEAGDQWVGGQRIEASGLRDCLRALQSATRGRPMAKGKRRGIGVSAFAHICGILSTSAIVRLLEDGSVTLNTGSVDLGQGAETVLAQICAESLKLPLAQVSVAQPDTDGSPYNWSTGGSRSTYMVGRAVAGAVDKVRDEMFRHAAKMLECSPTDLELRAGGKVGVKGADMEVGFRAVSQRAHWVAGGPIIGSAAIMYEGGGFDPKRTVVTGNAIGRLGAFIFGAQAVEVEVDDATGQVRLLKVWSAHDVGRAVNPAAVRGQILGGVAQGIGYALHEDLVQEQGRSANPNFVDYFVPGAADVPEIEPIIVEHPEPDGPFGAKGVGEPPIIGVAPAIANAVRAAAGVRLRELPITPERVLTALSLAAGSAATPPPAG